MFCTQCGIENQSDARFCQKCGHAMHLDKVIPDGAPTPTEEVLPPPETLIPQSEVTSPLQQISG